jgi:aspartyl protease family protein
MAIDGHFWVDAKINGRSVKFLVDSGATTTTVDRQTAKDAGVTVSSNRDQFVRTGNGVIRVASGRAESLTIGSITRRNVALEIADSDDLNVLGMNYLSTLSRWSVEGRWLVLVS